MEQKSCPHCGAALHTAASFCPYCARSISRRTQLSPPRRLSRRALRGVVLVLALAGLLLLLALWQHARPRTYDGPEAQVVYDGRAGNYRLCFAQEDTPTQPISPNICHSELNFNYRSNSRLYVTDPDSGELVTEDFLDNVASMTAQVICSDPYVSITCTQPQRIPEYFPNAAAVIMVDFSIVSGGEHPAELVCTVKMKNGDVIRLRQPWIFQSVTTYNYTSQDAPMETIEDLQALVDQVEAVTTEWDSIYFYLPPVVYEGGLNIDNRFINLVGSTGTDGQRTTFTGPTRAFISNSGVFVFSNIDFAGGGQGIGVEANARLHLEKCRVSGWEVGLLAAGNAWVNADQTVFEDNAVGMCFNAESGMVSDDYYMDNIFRNNRTAVLLERVPAPTPLIFPGTRFEGNDTDFDNRCGQPLDLSEAILDSSTP